jgi:hypothetical protein
LIASPASATAALGAVVYYYDPKKCKTYLEQLGVTSPPRAQ